MPSLNLGYGIWLLPLIGVILAIVIMWQNHKISKAITYKIEPQEQSKVTEIEITGNKLNKVMGINNKSPEERGAALRRKWLEGIPRAKEKDDEL